MPQLINILVITNKFGSANGVVEEYLAYNLFYVLGKRLTTPLKAL